jgi:hypothetical protein
VFSLTSLVTRLAAVGGLAVASLGSLGCSEAEPPPNSAVVELVGTPYERGFQHGQRFANRIRSFYTKLLTTSLYPYLNRERPDIASVLQTYGGARYDGGQFSYLLMLESAEALAPQIPQELYEEMQGVADGAELPFEDILILNTFFDTLLGFRAMTFFIRKVQAPIIVSVELLGGLTEDGEDNDGDGSVDEEGEGLVTPYDQLPHAIMTEVPTDARLRIVLRDQALLAIPEGVDPDSLRLQLGDTVIEAPHESIQTREFVEGGVLYLEMTLTPPEPLPPASVVSFYINVADRAWVEEPPPAKPRIMRAERFVFSTAGYGMAPHEIENRGAWDGFSQPPAQAFAVRGSATRDGLPVLAHHFAMLDNDTSHKHTVLFVHRPTDGIDHAVLGWTGAIGGFSGMNAAGLVTSLTNSDTLDLPMTAQLVDDLFNAKLLSSGLPGNMVVRQLLNSTESAQAAAEAMGQVEFGYGWNYLFADRDGEMIAVEVDGDALGDGDGGVFPFTPDIDQPGNVDAYGRRWSSVGPDDLRVAAHYRINADDAYATVLNYEITPQRTWTSYYYRSLRAYYTLGEIIASRYGDYDAEVALETLRTPDLVDTRDSMTAAVFEPAAGRFQYGLGTVPATDAEFQTFDFGAATTGGGAAP